MNTINLRIDEISFEISHLRNSGVVVVIRFMYLYFIIYKIDILYFYIMRARNMTFSRPWLIALFKHFLCTLLYIVS
jgi:hypothetical protein